MARESITARQFCRECINLQTGARLRRRDCKYWQYPTYCAKCGQVRNIVTGLTVRGQWKVFWGKLRQ